MLTQWNPYNRIGRPLEALGVRTPLEFLVRQRDALEKVQAARPFFRPAPPPTGPPASLPFVSGGRWVCLCACGNAPQYDPDWQLALCLECGAVYERLAPPDGWQEAERLLMQRGAMANRHWLPGEPLQQLVDENLAHGLPALGVA